MTSRSRYSVQSLISFFSLIFILLTALHGVVLFFIHQTQYKKSMELIVDYQENMIRLEQQKIGTEIQSILEKLSFLEMTVEHSLQSGRLPDAEEYLPYFRLIGEESGQFSVMRLLSDEGMELFRMDFDSDNNGILVPGEDLQDKKDRYYFHELQDEQSSIYISPLDLNIENRELEIPYNPVIRFGRSISDEAGHPVAYLILNYRALHILEDLGHYELLPKESFSTYLLNNEGFWLKGPDPEREFGFMHEGMEEETVAVNDKDLWVHLQIDQKGYFLLNGNLYVHRTLPLKSLIKPEWGQYISRNRQSDRSFYLVYFTSGEVLKEMSRNIYRSLLIPFLITETLILIISVTGAAGLVSYRKNKESLQFLTCLDDLTECLTPGAGKKILDKTWSLVRRRNSVLTVVYFDIQQLDFVRSRHGGSEGDRLILTIVEIARQQLRNSDFLVRLAECSFLMILPDCGKEQAREICSRIRGKLKDVNQSDLYPYGLDIKWGVLEADKDDHQNADQIINESRLLMEDKLP